ncbi:MAG TPA: cupin domain-containing protein [Alphaproteobacteria bacterium]|nr:cupin domain-containing protein [Alphaproteobacteria bacterium]
MAEQPLLDQGRTDTVVAAAEDLIVRMKVYASGGENELHAHTGEDHTFMVLQGSARFYGPDGETVDIAHQRIMLPRGAYYRFHATSKEPLVMIRVGSPNPRKQKKPYRIDIEGNELRGDSKENKSVPVVFHDGAFFGYRGKAAAQLRHPDRRRSNPSPILLSTVSAPVTILCQGLLTFWSGVNPTSSVFAESGRFPLPLIGAVTARARLIPRHILNFVMGQPPSVTWSQALNAR